MSSTSNTPTLRPKSQFQFNEHCLFCCQDTNSDWFRKKGINVFPVRTKDFQEKILKACNDREDDWAVSVRGRIKSVNDLHAADALYHQICSVNFRTGKAMPRYYSSDKVGKKRGRPLSCTDAFLEILSI